MKIEDPLERMLLQFNQNMEMLLVLLAISVQAHIPHTVAGAECRFHRSLLNLSYVS